MLLRIAVKKVEDSRVFKDFKDLNPDYKLAHAFCIVDNVQSDWQVGYYGLESDKVVVFNVGKDVVKNPEEDVFKKPDKKVNSLDLSRIKIDLEKALDIAESVVKEHYKGEVFKKAIVIVQNLDFEIYNLTLVTLSLSIINVRVNAFNGEVVSHFKKSIMSLGK